MRAWARTERSFRRDVHIDRRGVRAREEARARDAACGRGAVEHECRVRAHACESGDSRRWEGIRGLISAATDKAGETRAGSKIGGQRGR